MNTNTTPESKTAPNPDFLRQHPATPLEHPIADGVPTQHYTLTDEDITGDVEGVIMKAVMPYHDPSNPFLHVDELMAECRYKLAQILHAGTLSQCPNRAKVFAYIKVAMKNHLCSQVQKNVYTTKRGGAGPRRNQKKTSRKIKRQPPEPAIHASLNDVDHAPRVGVWDNNSNLAEFLEELNYRLSAVEHDVFSHLWQHGNYKSRREMREAIDLDGMTAALLAKHGLTEENYRNVIKSILIHCNKVLAEGPGKPVIAKSVWCLNR